MQTFPEKYSWEDTSSLLASMLIPESSTVSLFKLARAQRNGDTADSYGGAPILGIDGSSWVARCRREALTVARLSEQVEQQTLRLLFRRLCWLLGTPIKPLFVFDGRSSAAQSALDLHTSESLTTRYFKDFLQVFGFGWFLGRSCAAAELATMEKSGAIQVIMSEDIDPLLYGASCVVQCPPDLLFDSAEYVQGLAPRAPNTGTGTSSKPSRGDLLLGVLLLGGKNHLGLPGCSADFVERLIQRGVGNSTMQGLLAVGQGQRIFGEDRVQADTWRFQFQVEMDLDGDEVFPFIPQSFPSLDVLRSYTDALTRWPATSLTHILEERSRPDISGIANICARHALFSSSIDVVLTCRTLLWPGICLQATLEVARVARKGDFVSGGFPWVEGMPAVIDLVDTIHEPIICRFGGIQGWEISFPTEMLARPMLDLLPSSATVAIAMMQEHGRVWVPCDELVSAFPLWVDQHNYEQRRKGHSL